MDLWQSIFVAQSLIDIWRHIAIGNRDGTRPNTCDQVRLVLLARFCQGDFQWDFVADPVCGAFPRKMSTQIK